MMPHVNRHSWNFYLRPKEAWEAMYEDCRKATKSIELEQYIFEDDAIGRRFLELFITKVSEGVTVFMLCDRFGSASLYSSPLVKQFRRAGGYFRFYHPLTRWDLLTPWRWLPRTHNKILLIDSNIAYTGGVCFAKEMEYWRDTLMRISGPVVSDIRQHFFDYLKKRNLFRKQPKAEKNFSHYHFFYMESLPDYRKRTIYKELVRVISNAEHYIYITTSSFIPDRRFIRLLGEACARKVKVIVLVPENSDVWPADWVFLSCAGRLLNHGIRIFLYRDVVMHSKTMIVDDAWGTIGSTNMDLLSFFHNRESNLIITEPEAIMELKQHFIEDLKHSEELTPETLRAKPLWKKVAGYVLRWLKVFL